MPSRPSRGGEEGYAHFHPVSNRYRKLVSNLKHRASQKSPHLNVSTENFRYARSPCLSLTPTWTLWGPAGRESLRRTQGKGRRRKRREQKRRARRKKVRPKLL